MGYTPIADTSKYYSIWYQVAFKSKEIDVMGEICFAAVTSEELALDLGVDSVPSARFMLWNDTKVTSILFYCFLNKALFIYMQHGDVTL